MENVNKKTGECPEENRLSGYNERGEEVPDPTPVALPVGFNRPIPLGERIRKLVQDEALRRSSELAGVETFEDADDFDIPDDPLDSTPYEESFDPEFNTCREQELRAGARTDRTPEQKLKAAEIHNLAKQAIAKKAEAHARRKAKEEAEDAK